MAKIFRKSGLTLIEILITIAIILILISLSVVPFVTLNKTQAVDKDALLVLSVLSEARSLTLASKNGSAYGVHFSTSQVVLFTGTTYSASASSNRVNDLSNLNEITAINLTGGASDVVYDRLSGTTAQTGTITISSKSNSTITKMVTIFGSGTAEMN